MKIFSKKKHKEEMEEYSDYIIDLLRNPRNWGELPKKETSVSQSYTGPCGDTIQFFFKIKRNIIEKANFITDGCGASVATASQTTLLIEGKSLEYAEKLKPLYIDRALKGLPEDHKHCAELAVKTVRRAISKYRNNSV